MNPHDPAYSEKSIRELLAETPGRNEESLQLLASAIDVLRSLYEHLDERLRELEAQPGSAPSDDWPLAVQVVFGIDVTTPDEFVEWARRQSLTWEAPT